MRRPTAIHDGTADSADSDESRKPRHRHVFETLLGEISSGRFQPGDRLPTEAELAKTFSASRSTIARAMRDLKSRGLLNRQRGGGTHIARQEGKRIALFTPFTQSASDLGYIGGQIHGHLSELAAGRGDHLRLQVISRNPANVVATPGFASTSGLGSALISGQLSGPEFLDQMLTATRTLIQQGVAGVFYYPVELPQVQAHYNSLVVDKLLAAGIAVVTVDRDIVSFPERSRLPFVTYDNRRGGYLITDHLIRQGCRRIVFVGSPFASSAASDRQRGYFDALDSNGLPLDRRLVRPALLEDIDTAFMRALMDECQPDAIVCKMDHYAALVGRHLVHMGLTIGRDVLLAGFDDEPFAELLPVPLTTIRFPADPFAQVCYDRLSAQLADPSVPLPGMTLIDVELVVRGSTAGSRPTP